MSKKFLLAVILLVVFAVPGLFAQRDSLCMSEVDVWFRPDSAFYSNNSEYPTGNIDSTSGKIRDQNIFDYGLQIKACL